MNIRRFVANLKGAREKAEIIVKSPNEISVACAQSSLDDYIRNIIEELNTLIINRKINRESLLKSLVDEYE